MSLKILLIFLSLYDQFLWQLLVEGLGSVYKFIPTYTDLSWRMKVAESASAETGFVFAFFQVTGLKREFDAVFWQVVGLTDVDWLTDRPPPPHFPNPFHPPSLSLMRPSINVNTWRQFSANVSDVMASLTRNYIGAQFASDATVAPTRRENTRYYAPNFQLLHRICVGTDAPKE